MARTQCEKCDDEFANEYNRFRHERECPAGSEHGGSTGSGRQTEGTVETFFGEDGYGFVVTADVTTTGGQETSQDVFVHISDTDTEGHEERDQFRFDIIENEEGFQAKSAARIERNSDRSSDRTDHSERRRYIETARRMCFGNQVEDTMYGRETGPTEQDITDFEDDRKFR